MQRLFTLLVLVAAIVGCGDSETSVSGPAETAQPVAQAPPTLKPTETSVPVATSSPIADTATSTQTSPPEATNTPIPTATLEPTSTPDPTATPGRVGVSRNHPIPFGQSPGPPDSNEFILVVTDVIEDATQLVLDENSFNYPPLEGYQFFIVRVKVHNVGTEAQTFDASYRLRAVGESSVEYSQFSESCGTIPDEFDSYRDVFDGGELSGNICFSVKASDVGTLVLYDDGEAFLDSERIFYALPDEASIPRPTATLPLPTATPVPTNTPVPTATPVPTNTPDPTATPVPTNTPGPTATPTPVPIGRSPDSPIPLRDKSDLANLDGFSLRVVEVTQGRKADALVEFGEKISSDYSRVVIRIKVQNDGNRGENYNVTGRLQAYGLKTEREYKDWWRSDSEAYCGLGLDVKWDSYRDIDPGRSQTANVCFVVRKADVGALLLVDNGGSRGSYEDWQYWKLRQ